MSIDRSQLSQSVDQNRKAGAEPRREPPTQEKVDRFRQAMQGKQEARDEFSGARSKGAGELATQQRADAQATVQQAATRDAVDAGRHSGGDMEQSMQQRMDPAELLAMMQVQSVLREGTQAAPAAPAAGNSAAFADLIERHVRQLAVGAGSDASGRDGQVLLRMADTTLPGTDLLLSKTADGWLLRADVRSRDSYDAIREAAPELAKRFAERNLGTLEIDSRFDG